MRFAEPIVTALWRRAGSSITAISLAAALLTGCADGLTPLTGAGAPQALVVTSPRAGVVQLRWEPAVATAGRVVSYVVERRVAIDGAFIEVARVPSVNTESELIWIDTNVEPGTIYGYRVVALTDLGNRSGPSVVGGVVTPPPPGMEIVTTVFSTSVESLDPDGYQLVIAGQDTIRSPLSTTDRRRFAPLRPGTYTVSLTGIVGRCTAADSVRQVTVADTSAVTITPVTFSVTCKDPSRGEMNVVTTVTGDSLDDGWTIDVLGQASDTTLPVADRVFSAQRSQTPGAPATSFANLRPGTYNVTLRNLAGNCTLQGGSAERSAVVTPLGVATISFAVACVGSTPPPPPASNAPFIWRNKWVPKTAAAGATVALETSLDLTARTGQAVKGVQATLRYDPAVLRFDAEDVGQLTQLIINGSTPGLITFIASTPGNNPPRTGLVSVAKFNFTVIGASGTRSPTVTTGLLASSPTPFQDSVRVVEDTLTVGSGGGANQAPVAQFTGPTTGTVGTPVTFNGTGSTDADGTIASYAWTFGDNTTSTVASPSKTYTAAGTYTVTLTVTDNQGATASRTGSITVTAGTTPPPVGNAPVARANGPYTAQAGASLTLSSAGTTNATSFSWALGNGQTATGAAPTVTYATAGTYTIVLTVTGANGATSTSQATATITAPPPPVNTQPLVWRNLVQAYDVANNSIALQIVYDLNANVTETPGAEALRSFVVDSLKWDASKLQFLSLNYGPGMTDVSTNQTGASSGRLALRASTTPGLDQGNIVIATIRFRPIGTAGQTVTTNTFLGPLLGTTATNSFSYNSKTSIVEGQFTLP
jgi:PKD repeat protein